MRAALSQPQCVRVCDILGLTADVVRSLSIGLDVDGLITVNAEMYVEPDQADRIFEGVR